MSESNSLGHQLILYYFPELTTVQQNQFAELKELYSNWNAKVNVISRKDIESLYERHVLHSLAIAKIIQFRKGTKVLDIGTGGGFPGIPLAILFPEVKFHLIDSIGKKITVVNEVSQAIKLNNLFAEQERAEKVKDKYDFIVSRAVTDFSEIYNWTKNKFLRTNMNELPNGWICLKGGDVTEELKNYHDICKIHKINDYFKEEFFETKKVIYIPLK